MCHLLEAGLVLLQPTRKNTRLHPNNINRGSGIESMDAHGQETQQKKSHMTADQITQRVRIEIRQSQLLKTNQPQHSIMLYKVTRNQSTSLPEEDQHYAVKTSRSQGLKLCLPGCQCNQKVTTGHQNLSSGD